MKANPQIELLQRSVRLKDVI